MLFGPRRKAAISNSSEPALDKPADTSASRTATARVLVVDDAADTRLIVASALKGAGFEVDRADSGAAALAMVDRNPPDLVLLDIDMPGMSGLEVLTRLKATHAIPVILLTGLDRENDRVAGLDLGADDYITKPFFAKELAARVRAALRRAQATSPPPPPSERILQFGPLVIRLAEREVTMGGTLVELTAKEFDLLAYLASFPGTVFSRQQLLDAVWGCSTDQREPATVTEHVRRIRKKIGDDAEEPAWLVTIRRVGYRFDPPT